MTRDEQARETEWHRHRDRANKDGSEFWYEPPIPGSLGPMREGRDAHDQ